MEGKSDFYHALLRAGEVVGLNLDDIDWSAGQIIIRGKGGKSAPLPLAADAGASLAAFYAMIGRGVPR